MIETRRLKSCCNFNPSNFKFFAINKSIKTESNKVGKEVLLEVANPIYSALQKKYAYLNYIIIIDDDTKKDLKFYFILGQGIILK